MERLLPYYERELASLRESCRELSQRYPSLGGLLAGVGESTGDPSVETMIQATALLTARVAKRLDDDYPQFTEALLAMIEPDLLRPTVPASIVDIRQDAGDASAKVLPHGTTFHSPVVDGVRLDFSTVYDVHPAVPPLAAAAFATDFDVPPIVRLPRDASARISLRWPALPPGLEHGRLRLFVDGERSFVAALIDALFLHTVAAYVQPDGASAWFPLDRPPLALAGWDDEDALLPLSAQATPACRLIKEFFTFPEKFNFVEFDLAPISARLGSAGGTLHLVLGHLPGEAQTIRTLAALGPQHLRPSCTPAVNLTAMAAVPIQLDHHTPDYPLKVGHKRSEAFDIVGIQEVRLVDSNTGGAPVVLEPLYTLRHALAPDSTRYWSVRTVTEPERRHHIAIVDSALHPVGAGKQTVSADLLCSNGTMAADAIDTRSRCELHDSNGNAVVRFLRRPTRPAYFSSDEGIHWRLVAQLALGSRAITSLGVDELRALLSLYDVTRSPASARLIAGIQDVSFSSVMTWVGSGAHTCLMPGIDIRLTLDTSACAGTGVYVFACLLDRFFGLYTQINVFTRLTVWSSQDEELLTCPPRTARFTLA